MEITENIMRWKITNECNFNCKYCFDFPHNTINPIPPIDIHKVISTINKTSKTWFFYITGGEPFLVPNIIELLQALTYRHKIILETNLSISSRVKEFADKINPARIECVIIACHIKERRKKGNINEFIKNIKHLKEKGFNFLVNYVLSPGLINKFHDDYKFFKKEGIILCPKPYKGVFENKKYPLSYNKQAKDIFNKYNTNKYSFNFNCKGLLCRAGYSYLRIHPNGIITRCISDQTVLGNINLKIDLDSDMKECIVSDCPCFFEFFIDPLPSQRYFLDGIKYYCYGLYDKAITSFKNAIRLKRNFSSAYNNLGVIYCQKNNLKKGIDYLKKLLMIDSKNTLYLSNFSLGLAKINLKNNPEIIFKNYLGKSNNKELNDFFINVDDAFNLSFDLNPKNIFKNNSKKTEIHDLIYKNENFLSILMKR